MPTTNSVNGINLGGWLVLEKWITPSVFQGSKAVDEYGFCKPGGVAAAKVLDKHRRTFITKKDFICMKRQGITAVRIPVGYWLFGNTPPFIAAVDYLDKAFEWAEATGISVLLCLHGAPGSQNGEMHSGKQGLVGWHTNPANITASLAFIEKLARRYKHSPQLWGIELLNEPALVIPKRLLKSYYKQAYSIIRRQAGPNVRVVINDIYKPLRWNWTLRWPFYTNVYIDSHQYQVFTLHHKRMGLPAHIAFTKRQVAWQLVRMRWHHRIIVGEWSAALDTQSLTGFASHDLSQAYRTYFDIQDKIYAKTDGSFYWTYKTEADGPWSYQAMRAMTAN